MIKIKFKKLSDNAIIPTKGRDGDACFDLYAAEDIYFDRFSTGLVKTNIAIEIPEGYFGKIYTRSGMALKGWNCSGGVIDSNYRGDIGVILTYFGTDFTSTTVDASGERRRWVEIKKGDRIAQLAIHKVEDVEFEEVEELTETVRGEAGYGSSGV